MKKCDLHCHSNFSDGTFTPTELVKLAESGKTQEIAKKYKLENSVITDYSSQK